MIVYMIVATYCVSNFTEFTITPLVINALGGEHTHMLTHKAWF